MVCYSIRRNKYLKLKFLGRNNNGKITVRGRQRVFLEKKSKLCSGYEYIHAGNMKRFLYFSGLLRFSAVFSSKRAIYDFISFGMNSNKDLHCVKKVSSAFKVLSAGDHSFLYPGNILLLRNIPVGSLVHNVEGINSNKAVYVKVSKRSACVICKGDKYITVKLPSGELKLLNGRLYGIFGAIDFFKKIKSRKAGDSRRLGLRPKVRGVSMNACDHPHGGGEGKSSIGRKSIFSLWGKKCKGVRTTKLTKHKSRLGLK